MQKGRFLFLFGAISGLVGLVLFCVGVALAINLDSAEGVMVLPVILIVVGGLSALIGGILTLAARRTRARHRWLLTNGQEYWADIDEISRNVRVELNGRNPYVVTASFRDERSGHVYTATSDYVWQDPTRKLAGRQVRVLFDPASPDRNVIDLTTTRSPAGGPPTTAVLTFARAFTEMLPALRGLPTAEQDQVREHAASIEAEAGRPSPDVERLRMLVNRLNGLVARAGTSSSTTLLGEAGHEAVKELS